jgi:plastocyanin
MIWRPNRRELMKTLGMGAVAGVLPTFTERVVRAEDNVVQIRATSNNARGEWYFDPAGLFIEKGQTVRWVAGDQGPTVTAFHPSNYNHELRIPENAEPFNSRNLMKHGRLRFFELTFDVEGTYDYFARTFEPVGMVGRVVVGRPGGPAEMHPPGYGGREGRAPVFPAQAKLLAMLPSSEIVARKTIPYPAEVFIRNFPYGDFNH